ncbi:hypothetical protein E2562_011131 [Oryza meyeriana var. granulata]|uniref:Protein kinase domain-containing protein n=1 Tax=Oryza meyeriana var. granulata TaxID=110450 RepID=A0A6G1DGF9_9ORYZ|nr:hypothetical protein E2562_011131 [Oryza meyeriana var. granulata]
MCKSRSDALPVSSIASQSRRSSSTAAATTTTSSSSSSSRPGPASSSLSASTASAASSTSLATARTFLSDPPSLLASTARYHHTSIAPLLGACLAGPHLYLAYELPPGAATLAACLRSPRNPSFTALPTWLSRVQVAADIAQGLEYIHHHAAAVHGRVSPSTVLVSDPGLRARLTHMGAAQLAEMDDEKEEASREADAVAERLLEVGLRCAAEERPPEMTWVAGKVSKAYLESRAWEQTIRPPPDLSVSLAPR